MSSSQAGGLTRGVDCRSGRKKSQDRRKQKRQKPSNARPTQLTANIDEAMAATEAKVTMVLTDSI
jgi:hypothetical protein